jgi:aminoglycoside phosphotransferase (APT) family kinase protein
MNEAESLRYISQHTNIPVPTVYSDFEDDDAYYLVVEYVEGVNMADLSDKQKTVVLEELTGHLATLKTLRSNRMGGPSGIAILPYRVMRLTETDSWDFQTSDREEYFFCHNDLSQHNILVDPSTLKITAIVDWEYAGFYPARFEMPFYTRVGPSVALEDKGEVDDSAELLAFLESKNKSAA